MTPAAYTLPGAGDAGAFSFLRAGLGAGKFPGQPPYFQRREPREKVALVAATAMTRCFSPARSAGRDSANQRKGETLTESDLQGGKVRGRRLPVAPSALVSLAKGS